MSFKRKNGQAPAKKDYTQLKTPHTYAIIFGVRMFCWLWTVLILRGILSTDKIEYTDSDGATASRTGRVAGASGAHYTWDGSLGVVGRAG